MHQHPIDDYPFRHINYTRYRHFNFPALKDVPVPFDGEVVILWTDGLGLQHRPLATANTQWPCRNESSHIYHPLSSNTRHNSS